MCIEKITWKDSRMKKKHFISIKNKIILALLPIIVVTYGLVCTLTVMRMNTEITEEL